MTNVKLILFVSLLSAFVCGACNLNSTSESQINKSCTSSPSERVSEYESKLLQRDFVGINRYYSKRVLQMKLNNRTREGCKDAEDCLTPAYRIMGFEVTIAGGRSKTLKETPTSDVNRKRVETVASFPFGGKIAYELLSEDGDWYIDKALWENGEVIAGFDEASLSEGEASVTIVSPK